MSDKLFDCYFIATDSNNVTKVRFANDYDKRKLVLMRDKFTILSSDKFESKFTKEQILEQIDENDLSDVEMQAYVNARKAMNKKKTTFEDVRLAILSRKTEQQEDTLTV